MVILLRTWTVMGGTPVLHLPAAPVPHPLPQPPALLFLGVLSRAWFWEGQLRAAAAPNVGFPSTVKSGKQHCLHLIMLIC